MVMAVRVFVRVGNSASNNSIMDVIAVGAGSGHGSGVPPVNLKRHKIKDISGQL